MNPDALFARLRQSLSTLSGGQITTLVLTFVGVVGLVAGSAYWINTPTYAVLFSDMDAESAGNVVTRLKTEKVQFMLDDGGRTIRVPAARVDELRLSFASQGMPASGRIGFEIFDRTAFGVTDFLEHVNYRRALEGELARTIGTIAEVASARVHIAMPKTSLFVGQDEGAKASVVLKLKSNRQPSPSTIAAISGLVAAAVESLRPESVVIIDNFGRPLTRNADGADQAASAAQAERQDQVEHEMSSRVVSLLEPLVGAGGVRVNVSAVLNTGSVEETEERWDPTTVVRSHQTASQGTGAGSASVGGIAGARANLPPDAAAKPPAPAPAPAPQLAGSNTSETTNYEVSRLTRHRVQPEGAVTKLSVAVLLNEAYGADPSGKGGRVAKPRTAEETQKIHDVVAAAVGFDEDRGDQLTVETVAFEEPVVEEAPPEPWWKRNEPLLFDGGRVLAIVLVAGFALFGVVRPALKRTLGGGFQTTGGGQVGPGQKLRTVADIEGEIDAELDAALEPGKARLPILTSRATKLAKQEPENAARLVRSWLAEEER